MQGNGWDRNWACRRSSRRTSLSTSRAAASSFNVQLEMETHVYAAPAPVQGEVERVVLRPVLPQPSSLVFVAMASVSNRSRVHMPTADVDHQVSKRPFIFSV